MIGLLLTLALGLAPAPAADPQTSAESAYAAGEYDDAAERFGALYEQTEDPAHKYAQAQALRLAGRDTEAADAYEVFITRADALLPTLDEETQATVTLMIGNAEVQARGCRERATPEREPEPTPEPAPEPEPPPPVVNRPATSDVLPPAPRRVDATAVTLWTTGGVAAVVGAVLVGTASARAAGTPMGSHDQWVEERTRARLQQQVGFAVLGVGGALLTGAVLRTVIVKRRRSQPVRVRAGL